jgi:predicted nucleic acid-binding protein
MPYLIQDIKKSKPIAGGKYLFDANIWIYVLDSNFSKPFVKSYIDFFNAIIENKLSPKATVVLPSLLISEILNRRINDIYYNEFCISNPRGEMAKPQHYKTVYRISDNYKLDLEMACKEIRDYNIGLTLLSDNFDKLTFKKVLKNIPHHLDFNDHIFCTLAKEQDLIIVTNDQDFKVEDVNIITSNPKLLDTT